MFSNNVLLTVRTILCAIATFNSVDELLTFVEETRGQDLTVFNCNFDNEARNAYGPVHFLSEPEHDAIQDFVMRITAALIYQPLLKFTELSEMFTTTESIGIFKELVLHNLAIMDNNSSHSSLTRDRPCKKCASTSKHSFVSPKCSYHIVWEETHFHYNTTDQSRRAVI